MPVTAQHGRNGTGTAGALTQLFERYPDIKAEVEDTFLKKYREGVVHESRMPVAYIHVKFIKALRANGVTHNEYPFNVKCRADRALSRYLRSLFKKYVKEAVKARYGENAARIIGVDPSKGRTCMGRAYEQVQFDAHKIDAMFVIKVPHPLGGEETVTLHRLWVLVLIDSASRAILGYYVSLNRECSAQDLLAPESQRLWQIFQEVRVESQLPGSELPMAYLSGTVEHVFRQSQALEPVQHDAISAATWKNAIVQSGYCDAARYV
jgi:aerobic-type carbon monoxide dehydrogenase small subunit (CoxS/CutS family)